MNIIVTKSTFRKLNLLLTSVIKSFFFLYVVANQIMLSLPIKIPAH